MASCPCLGTRLGLMPHALSTVTDNTLLVTMSEESPGWLADIASCRCFVSEEARTEANLTKNYVKKGFHT